MAINDTIIAFEILRGTFEEKPELIETLFPGDEFGGPYTFNEILEHMREGTPTGERYSSHFERVIERKKEKRLY